MFYLHFYASLIICNCYFQFIFCTENTTINKNVTVNNTILDINEIGASIIETNLLCFSQNLNTGVCKNYRVCINQGGQASGYCRINGPRVCCVFNSQNNQALNTNPFYFQNPGYPSSYFAFGSNFTRNIYRAKPNYSQIRLDFVQFSIETTNELGICDSDTFSISNGNYRTPNICGATAGTSVYIKFEGNNPIELRMDLNPSVYAERIWNIRYIQIAS